jgi:hypothetical protein
MAYANSSETELSFIEESVWGVTPATPTFERARMTGEGLVYDIQTTTSEEISPASDVTDEVQVGASASGPINFELSFGSSFDLLLEHALRGAFDVATPGDDLEELKAGTAKKSLSIEKSFDVGGAKEYSRYSGMVANSLNLTVEQQAIVSGSIDFLGKGEATDSVEITGASYNAPSSGKPMAAPDVANITVGGVAGSIYYSSLSFTLNNNASVQAAIGVKDAVGVKYGQRQIEGNLSAYFDADTAPLYDKFVQGAESSISFDLIDDQANTYTITFPRIRFTTGRRVAGGNGEDVVAEMGFRALLDPSEGCSIKIVKTAPGS